MALSESLYCIALAWQLFTSKCADQHRIVREKFLWGTLDPELRHNFNHRCVIVLFQEDVISPPAASIIILQSLA